MKTFITFCIFVGEREQRILALIVRCVRIFLRFFTFGAIILAGVVSALFVLRAFSYVYSIPSPRTVSDFSRIESVDIFDRNGILLYRPIRVNTHPIHLSELSQSLKSILVSQVKTTKIIPVLAQYILLKEKDKRTLSYYLKASVISLKLRMHFSDDQLLESFINIPFYNGVSQGMDNAALQYFNKHIVSLSESEALFLTRIPIVPYPTLLPIQSIKHSNEYKRAAAAVDLILENLEKRYSALIEEGVGLDVYTTIDARLQNSTQSSLVEQSIDCKKEADCNNAIVVVDLAKKEVFSIVSLERNFS